MTRRLNPVGRQADRLMKSPSQPAVVQVIQQLRPLGPRAAPSGTGSWSSKRRGYNPPHPTSAAASRPVSQRGLLRLTSGRLCWRPALRHLASMSEPHSCRPPWALLSYYSHSCGCCRGCRTSKRTFTPSLSLSLFLSLSFSLHGSV